MNRLLSRWLFLPALLLALATAVRGQPLRDAGTWQASGSKGAVVAGGQGAVDAGLALLKSGGNAADAAVATLLALSVTDSGSFCFGGEVPIMVYDARRKMVEVLAGQGVAPRLARRAYFANKKGGIPGKGIEPAAVPAALDACLTALDHYGTRTFAEVAAPTLALLDRKAKPWHADLARTLRRLIEAEKASPGDRRRGLRLVADYFFRGPLAREIDTWSRANGGLLRSSDLATHVTRVEEPVSIAYRGHTVYKCGPWTQGPYLLQTLRLLEGFDLKGMGHNKPATIHVTAEAMKLALADRDVYYADPLFAQVPLEALLSKKYADLRRPLIDRKKASLERRPGDPRGGKALLDREEARKGLGGPANDTTTCLVADAQGNVVAATPSGWSGVLAGKTGVWLGTRLQSFNIWQGHPNCIEPGKRPRITLSPTLVLKDDKPVLAISVAGGDGQDQATLQVLLNAIDFGMAPAEAVTAARFGTNHLLGSFRQTPPQLGSLLVYREVGEETIKDLEGRGHKVKVRKPPLWAPTALSIDPKTGMMHAAGDPRARRHAGAVAGPGGRKVSAVPPAVREQLSLSPFYKKYVDAGGFAVVGSAKVSDAALREAAYIVDQMLAGRDDVRQALIKNRVRLAVMAPMELTTDIPEHSDLKPKDYWDRRARGLGPTRRRPAVSCAEENLLNLKDDRYHKENILVHEFAHAIHEMGLNNIDRKFDARLHAVYKAAMDRGLWKKTYAATNYKEYWAEGVQSYFDCNAPEGHDHNGIDTRAKLAKYDPDLFKLIDEVFRQSKWRYARHDKRHPPSRN